MPARSTGGTGTGAVVDRLARALQLHQRGEREAAAALYREVLAADPRNYEALQLLGTVALQSGEWAVGISLLHRSLAIEPKQPQVWMNLGDAQSRIGELPDAVSSYAQAATLEPSLVEVHFKQALALQRLQRLPEALAVIERLLVLRSDHIEALNVRGNVLLALRRPADAVASYGRVLTLKPDYAEALHNRGYALLTLGRPEEALESIDLALKHKPTLANAWTDRGTVLAKLNRLDESLASYERALSLDPRHSTAHNNRGNVLLDLHRPEEALASYDAAVRLRPDFADAWNNQGTALLKLRRLSEAMQSNERALALSPESPDALNNRGHLFIELQQPQRALSDFRRALALRPGAPDILNNLGGALADLGDSAEAAAVFAELRRVSPHYDFALGHLLRARMLCCDWRDYDSTLADIDARVSAGQSAIKPFAYLGVSNSPALQLACARLYAREKFPSGIEPLWRGERYRHDRIRVAYLSADLHAHATAYLMAELFERHDRQRFEITAVSFGPDRRDAMRGRLVAAFDEFVDVRDQSDREVAALLRSREIDIVVDLKGYTFGCRPGILAHRAAPVQASWLGYPGTLGTECIDWIIADRTVIPEEDQQHYAERVMYLPDCYQPNDTHRSIADVTPSRAAAGLPQAGFVFCCFNNPYKITPPVFDVWIRLLQQTPGSVLWLLADTVEVERNLRSEAAARGVAAERLVFAPRVALPEHLARHRLADLFLDTLPYNAHTTASDALWAGVPVITTLGGTFAGRVAGSLLRAVGLPELVTESLADYELLASKLAAGSPLLAELRGRLATNRLSCPLFDTARFCSHLEAAFVAMLAARFDSLG